MIDRFLPGKWQAQWHRIRQYSMGVLLAIVLLAPRVLDRLFAAAVEQWARLL